MNPFEEERDAALAAFELKLDQRERDDVLEEFCDRLEGEDFWYDEEERHELF